MNGDAIAGDAVAGDLLVEREGGLVIATLNRSRALNTLTLAMCRGLTQRLGEWERDPSIGALLLRGAGDRAFCAGGDVRAIYDEGAAEGSGAAAPGSLKTEFFRDEYRLIQRIHRLARPVIASIDGITMGGGAGLSINASHRIATERTLFAMPETAIGLFPDVGATRFLNRCPGRIGLYLALTGARLAAADLLHCGLATHYVPRDRLTALTAALAANAWRPGGEHAQLDAILARFAADPGPPPLRALGPAIDRCFSGPSLAAIVAAVAREEGEWARQAEAALARASPMSLAITFRQMAQGRGMEIEAALALEYRLSQHAMAGHDFFEGVRALLVDKDQAPRWRPASPAEVSEEAVARHFAPLGERELRFS